MSAGTPPQAARLGRQGERAAAALLTRAGLRVLARNWRAGRLELDLVCRDGDTLVFVEVKTRSTAAFGGPAAAVSPAKRRALSRAAQIWLDEHGDWDRPCRFDVVCVVRAGEALELEHYPHAFDYEPPVGHRHAAWQPW